MAKSIKFVLFAALSIASVVHGFPQDAEKQKNGDTTTAKPDMLGDKDGNMTLSGEEKTKDADVNRKSMIATDSTQPKQNAPVTNPDNKKGEVSEQSRGIVGTNSESQKSEAKPAQNSENTSSDKEVKQKEKDEKQKEKDEKQKEKDVKQKEKDVKQKEKDVKKEEKKKAKDDKKIAKEQKKKEKAEAAKKQKAAAEAAKKQKAAEKENKSKEKPTSEKKEAQPGK